MPPHEPDIGEKAAVGIPCPTSSYPLHHGAAGVYPVALKVKTFSTHHMRVWLHMLAS